MSSSLKQSLILHHDTNENELVDMQTSVHHHSLRVPSSASSLHSLPRNHASLSNYHQIKSVSLSFENIAVSVTAANKEKKFILDGVSGYVRPGGVLCILGPSGCGKTTLLNTLCGVQRASAGSIYYDGKLKKISNGGASSDVYIAQSVVLLSSLTVKETLRYAAQLKYVTLKRNQHQTEREVQTFIDETISYLGLHSCCDTLVGGHSLMSQSSGSGKGQISGGQQKRLAIGVELMSQPALLFLDEVTSGLDATSAYQVFGIIHRLSQLGHSIVVTLHQPSSRLFGMMKEYGFLMMILQRGKTMYFGPSMDSVSYFESVVGCALPSQVNPIDYFLDIVNDDYTRKRNQQPKDELDMLSSTQIHEKYRRNLHSKILREIEAINSASNVPSQPSSSLSSSSDLDSDHEKISSWRLVCVQCWVLIRRNFWNDIRNIGTYWIRVIMYVLLCLCIGSMFFDLENTIDNIHDRVSVLFFIVTFLTFLSIAGIPSFLESRSLYIRETLNGHYNAFAYSVANFVSTIPWLLLIAIVVSVILFFMIQDHGIDDAHYFGIFFLGVFMTAMASESMVVTVSAMSGGQFMIAFAISGGLMALYIALCGFFLLPNNIPWYWIWVHYALSFHTYSFQIFMYNDFYDFTIGGEMDGKEVLSKYDMEHVDLTNNFLILLSMMLFYRVLFYLLLRFFVRAT